MKQVSVTFDVKNRRATKDDVLNFDCSICGGSVPYKGAPYFDLKSKVGKASLDLTICPACFVGLGGAA